MIKIQGNSIDSKFRSVERLIQGAYKRFPKVATAIVPPIPIMGYVDKPADDGTLYRGVIPADGYLSRFCLLVSHYSPEARDAVDFSCEISRQGGLIASSLQTHKTVTIEEINIEVLTGDLLRISVADPSLVSGVGISLIYQVHIKETLVHRVLMAELEQLGDLDNGDQSIS
ncbi:hypothetical protein LCGC14_2825470 [marine sediment metagenome]|uniref:Uncharacterized protein n=1 Tax=marine sediment metagenome TaxID=412755 RepID=A0A0F9AP39_9ZZZZ